MKKTFAWVCLAMLLQAAAVQTDRMLKLDSATVSQLAGRQPHLTETSSLKMQSGQEPFVGVARQVPATDAPVENRESFSWWWWILGVIIILGLGMWMYTLIKKNPKKDAT